MSEGRDRGSAHAAEALIDDWSGEAPDPERLGAYLDGELDPVEHGIVEGWLEDDPALAAELARLRDMRRDLGLEDLEAPRSRADGAEATASLDRVRRSPRNRPGRRPAGRWIAAAAAAALGLVALGLVLRGGPTSPRGQRVVDGGFEITVARGRLEVVGELPPPFAESIRTALLSGRLPVPESVRELRGPAGPLLSEDGLDGGGPTPLSPLATAVPDPRPLLRWRPVPGAIEYRIVVADGDLRPVAGAPSLTEAEWRPPAALPAGQPLRWQVTAVTETGAVTAPTPPAPEARFTVLTADQIEALHDRLELADDSRLAGALAYLEAGVVEAAVHELDRLAEGQAEPELVEDLKTSLASPRR